MKLKVVVVAVLSSGAILAGTAAASASSTPSPVPVQAQVSSPSPTGTPTTTDTFNVTSPPVVFKGAVGTTATQTVTWQASSSDPNGYKVTVQATSPSFTGPASLLLNAWNMTVNNDGAVSAQPVTVYSSPTQGSQKQTDTFTVKIPNEAVAGTYTIPKGGFQYSVVNN